MAGANRLLKYLAGGPESGPCRRTSPPAGQRVRKVTGTSKPHFAYDQNGQLLGEYNSSGGVL